MQDSQIDFIIEKLWASEEGQAFALLDAARDERIYPLVRTSKLDYRSLFLGNLGHELTYASPYLISLGSTSALTRAFLKEGWADNWGIFGRSSEVLQDLRRHFRWLLQVQDEAGKTMFFRYYDPRVLRTYLPACNSEEAASFFGPVTHYYAENEGGSELLEFSFDNRQLRQVEHVLPGGEASPQEEPAEASEAARPVETSALEPESR